MTTHDAARPPTQPGRGAVLSRLIRNARRRLRRMSDRSLFLVVIAFSLAGTVWSFLDFSHNVRVGGVAVMAMVFGSLVLGSAQMVAVVALLTAGLLFVVIVHGEVSSQLTASGVLMLTSVAAVSITQARRRESLGLRRISAESVLQRVRHRLRVQGAVPSLPHGWRVDIAQQSAHRAAFAGDFVSARVHDVDGVPHLELALVDVSGSGIEAGSRALLLSGAVGGLLGAVPADAFLDCANDYLRRQEWGSGFASASYLRVNLASGRYEVRNAGHPPPIRWSGADRTAARTAISGTVLGVADELGLQVESGRLGYGDALIAYTDGVIEDRATDLDTSIGQLQDAVAIALQHGPVEDIAQRLANLADLSNASGEDDRTLVVVWNDGTSRPDSAPYRSRVAFESRLVALRLPARSQPVRNDRDV